MYIAIVEEIKKLSEKMIFDRRKFGKCEEDDIFELKSLRNGFVEIVRGKARRRDSYRLGTIVNTKYGLNMFFDSVKAKIQFLYDAGLLR